MAEDILDTPAASGEDDPTQPATVASGPGTPASQGIVISPAEQASVRGMGWKNDHPTTPTKPTPPVPQRSAGWGQKMSDLWNTVKSGTTKMGEAVARGGADAADGLSNTIMDAATPMEKAGLSAARAITGNPTTGAGFDKWYHSDDGANGAPAPLYTTDALFGKRQGGIYDFAEHMSAFTTSYEAGGAVADVAGIQPGAVKALVKVGLVGLAQAVSTDPRAARLSDMIENGPAWLSNPITRFLKSNGTDSDALARIKNGVEGIVTGATIDAFIGGLKSVARAIKGGGTDVAAGTVTADDVPPSAPSPYTVKAQDDGTFAVQGPEAPASTGAPTSAPDSAPPAPPELPVSSSAADAESHAASLNEAYNTSSIPTGHIDDTHIAALTKAINGAQAGSGMQGLKLPSDAFNYNYLGGTPETQAVVQTIADHFQEAFTGLKGRVSEGAGTSTDAFVAKATALVRTTNADSWLADARNTADAQGVIDSQQFARKIVLNQLAGKVATLSRALDTNPTNAVAGANLKAATEQLLQLGAETSAIDSGFGRSLQRLKNVIPDLNDGADAADVTVGAKPPNFTDNFEPKDWQDLARQVRLSGGDASLIQDAMYGSVAKKVAETSGNTSMTEKVNAFRANMMLSGTKTQFKLAASQALSSVWSSGEYWLGGNITRGMGLLRGNAEMAAGGAQDAQFGKDALFGLTQNFRAAWRASGRSLMKGGGVLDPGMSIETDEGQAAESSISNLAMRAMNVPTSLTQANHEFFKNVDYLSAIRGLSMRAAREDLAQMPEMSVEEQNQFIAGRLADDLRTSTNPTTGAALNPVALAQARDATFSAPLTGFAKTIQGGIQKYPLLRFIAPFVRTPINLVRYSWQRTPLLGLASRQMQSDLEAGGIRRSAAIGKQASGTMLWGTIAGWAAAGNMTGDGPTDKELRQQWLDAGHQAYSVRIPGTNEWMSYRGIDQLSKVMSLVSDMTEMSGEVHEEVSSDIAAKFVVAASKDVTNQSFMQGISQFSDAFDSGDPNKAKALFGGVLTSFVPALGRQVDTPDVYTEVRGLVDQLKSSVPHMSSTLEPQRNILGEKVIKPPGNLLQQMNPFTLRPGADINDVQEQLVQLGRGMAMPSSKVGGIDLTDRGTWKRNAKDTQSPYDRMLELQGNMGNGMPSLRAKLTELMQSDGWAKMGAGTDQYPGGERYDAASHVIKAYQGAALAKVETEYPGLLNAIQMAKGQSTRALAAPLSARTNSTASPAFIQ